MSQFKTLAIPASIMNLPIVMNAARVFNGHGNFMDISQISTANLSPAFTGSFELWREKREGQFGPVRIQQLKPDQVEDAYQQNRDDATRCYDSGAVHEAQADTRYKISTATGVVSVLFIAVATAKAKTLFNMPSCFAGTFESVNDARCLSEDYNHARGQLKNEAVICGVGAAIIGVAAVAVFQAARRKMTESKIDFVKAALAQGNIQMCENVLGNNDQAGDASVSLEPQ